MGGRILSKNRMQCLFPSVCLSPLVKSPSAPLNAPRRCQHRLPRPAHQWQGTELPDLSWVVGACISDRIDKDLVKQSWHLGGIQAGWLPDGDDKTRCPGGRCGESHGLSFVGRAVAAARFGVVGAIRADRGPGKDGGRGKRYFELNPEITGPGPEVASGAKTKKGC